MQLKGTWIFWLICTNRALSIPWNWFKSWTPTQTQIHNLHFHKIPGFLWNFNDNTLCVALRYYLAYLFTIRGDGGGCDSDESPYYTARSWRLGTISEKILKRDKNIYRIYSFSISVWHSAIKLSTLNTPLVSHSSELWLSFLLGYHKAENRCQLGLLGGSREKPIPKLILL